MTSQRKFTPVIPPVSVALYRYETSSSTNGGSFIASPVHPASLTCDKAEPCLEPRLGSWVRGIKATPWPSPYGSNTRLCLSVLIVPLWHQRN